MFLFLLNGICHLDNDALRIEHLKILTNSALQREPLNLNVNYVTVMKYTCTYQILTRLEYLRVCIASTTTWISC